MKSTQKSSGQETERQLGKQGLSFWEVLGSTFAAALGVQTHANRVRDFNHGRFIHYVISGILFVAIFVFIMILIVRWVLASGVS